MIVATAFAQAVLRLHARQGGDPSAAELLQQAAVSLWQASSEGHTCIEIDDPGLRDVLAASPAVASPTPAAPPGLLARTADELAAGASQEPAALASLERVPHALARDAPLVLDAALVLDGKVLYLQRLWQAETQLAQGLDALDAPAPIAERRRIEQLLDELAPESRVDRLQRAAIATALTRRLTVVTGGPGTGKTTTIARLLVACTRLAPRIRVAIAAPTGKAAARLAQALAAQLAQLDPEGGLAQRLPATGMTVHRLLGLRGEEAQAVGDAPRYDLVIVDEASMLDLELARTLIESLPEGGRLVLAGDRDQLASVEAGAVFAELCASGLDGVTRLERNYRQAGAPALTALAGWLRDRCQAVEQLAFPCERPDTSDPQYELPFDLPSAPPGRRPSAPPARTPSALPARERSEPPFDPVAGVERFPPRGAEPVAAQALAAWEPALLAIAAGDPAVKILAGFDRHRVLCALREGPLGAAALNAAIAARVRRRVAAPPGALWYPGRLVIVTRNRPELGLSNGDVGICLPVPGDESGALAVAFDVGGAEVRWQPVRQMPAHEDAYAITVHKSQGSEFDSVALLPAPRGHRLNTRELLYTGATRARRRLAVWADAETLEDGARRRSARHGRLADRIAALRAARGDRPRAAKDPHLECLPR